MSSLLGGIRQWWGAIFVVGLPALAIVLALLLALLA